MELNWLVIEWKSLMMSPLAELLTCCQNWKCWEMIFSRINCIKTWIFTSRHFYLSSGSFISDRLSRLVSKTEVTSELASFYFLLFWFGKVGSKPTKLKSQSWLKICLGCFFHYIMTSVFTPILSWDHPRKNFLRQCLYAWKSAGSQENFAVFLNFFHRALFE